MLDNGDFYDPQRRSSMLDFADKHPSHEVCAPYYISDSDAGAAGDPANDPAANYAAYHHLATRFSIGLNLRYRGQRHWGS